MASVMITSRPWLALLAICIALPSAFAGENTTRAADATVTASQSTAVRPPGHANLGQEHASIEAVQVADWVVDSANNQGMPFMIVDKVNARVLMFDASGKLQGAASALLGLARGDDSTPGIGERKLSTIRPDERTTPAGRFVASLAPDIHGEEILWIDYSTAISLHRVIKGTPAERRAQRLASPAADDKRISYGCINVPVKFYEQVVSPAFMTTSGVVYILPETRSAREVFGSYIVRR
ncbi:MAG: hypothetical protein V4573_13360 [Pseudomonadota bacterium]